MGILTDLKEKQVLMREDVMKAKDQALIWIYLIEWCIILATLMICGVTLNNLMVKRKLYREVTTSKLNRYQWSR